MHPSILTFGNVNTTSNQNPTTTSSSSSTTTTTTSSSSSTTTVSSSDSSSSKDVFSFWGSSSADDSLDCIPSIIEKKVTDTTTTEEVLSENRKSSMIEETQFRNKCNSIPLESLPEYNVDTLYWYDFDHSIETISQNISQALDNITKNRKKSDCLIFYKKNIQGYTFCGYYFDDYLMNSIKFDITIYKKIQKSEKKIWYVLNIRRVSSSGSFEFLKFYSKFVKELDIILFGTSTREEYFLKESHDFDRKCEKDAVEKYLTEIIKDNPHHYPLQEATTNLASFSHKSANLEVIQSVIDELFTSKKVDFMQKLFNRAMLPYDRENGIRLTMLILNLYEVYPEKYAMIVESMKLHLKNLLEKEKTSDEFDDFNQPDYTASDESLTKGLYSLLC